MFTLYTNDTLLSSLQNELLEAGVDLSSNDYYRHPEFIKRSQGYIIGLGMSVGWAIEYYLIGQERLEKIYGCYDLRIHRELTVKESRQVEWHTSLADRFPEYSRDSKDIYQYFNRKKKGLVNRLKDLGIDIKAFSNQSEEIRLLYFLYGFEKQNNIKITPFLSNPTLENIDNRLVGDITKNGDIMEKFKNSIAMGISNDFIKTTKGVIYTIALQWEEEIARTLQISSLSDSQTNIYELTRINYNVEKLLRTFTANSEKNGAYAHSLLETVYLKLCQHENIGRENDIIDVQNSTREACNNLPNCVSHHYLSLRYKVVKKEDTELFIKKNRCDLARLVYDKDVISSNEYTRFDTAASKVPVFLEMLDDNTRYISSEVIPALLVVACIQEIMALGKCDIIENKFYRYKSSDQKTLSAEMKNGKDAFRKNQLALIARVLRRMNSMAGRNEENKLFGELETKIDVILRKIFTCNSIDDMLYLNDFFRQLFQSFSLKREWIDYEAKQFTDAMAAGYVLGIEPFCYEYFFGTVFDSSITLDLADIINDQIRDAEKTQMPINKVHKLELTDDCCGASGTYMANFFVDPFEKMVRLLKFSFMPDEEGEQRLIKNGIVISR